jgi:hypothetical protein
MPLEIDNTPVAGRVRAWLNEAKALPDIDTPSDLFAPRNYKTQIIEFMEYVLVCLPNPQFIQRVAACDLSKDCSAAWREMNSPGHPVRDGLILLNHGLLL